MLKVKVSDKVAVRCYLYSFHALISYIFNRYVFAIQSTYNKVNQLGKIQFVFFLQNNAKK